MRHPIWPVRHPFAHSDRHAFTAPPAMLRVSPARSLNRDTADNTDTTRRSFPCKDGLCLCRDILLMFGVTLTMGWLVGGMVAKLFTELVTR